MPETRTLVDIQNQLQSIRPQLRDDFGVAALKVFGSYARDDQTPEVTWTCWCRSTNSRPDFSRFFGSNI